MYQQGQSDYTRSSRTLGPSVHQRLEGHHPALESRELGPGETDGTLQKGRRAIFRQHGCRTTTISFCGIRSCTAGTPCRWGRIATWSANGRRRRRKTGLPFGVSEHLGASFTWFQDAHRSDQTGPLAGVPYDGANSNYWDLYHFPADPGDRGWYSKNPRWQQEWFNEIEELVDNYKPDLLYSDGGVPFGNEVGLSQIANFYNVNAAAHHGKCQAVYTCKQPSGGRWVQDYERGVDGGISPYPWQTDTSIGDWFYNRHWKYQPLSWIVHMLVDIVSKNGNLLLNVVLRPDGTLDPEVETMLHQLADWTAVNGEAIYGTRPWLVLRRRAGARPKAARSRKI